MSTESEQPSHRVPVVKDFATWSVKKNDLQNSDERILSYKERDIWWLSLGHNIGDEEDGKGDKFSRPVLVIKGFSRNLFWGIPLSTTGKTGKYYYHFTVNGKGSTALLSQLRTFDARRLLNKYAMVPTDDFNKMRQILAEFITE